VAVEDVADAFLGDVPDLAEEKGKLVGWFVPLLGCCRREKNKRKRKED